VHGKVPGGQVGWVRCACGCTARNRPPQATSTRARAALEKRNRPRHQLHPLIQGATQKPSQRARPEAVLPKHHHKRAAPGRQRARHLGRHRLELLEVVDAVAAQHGVDGARGGVAQQRVVVQILVGKSQRGREEVMWAGLRGCACGIFGA